MIAVQTKATLTAATGAVAKKQPRHPGQRDDEADYHPAGWDHVIAAWTVACAENSAECNLAQRPTTPRLPDPTFSFIHYRRPSCPPRSDSENLKPARTIRPSIRGSSGCPITFDPFSGAKNAIAFKGSQTHFGNREAGRFAGGRLGQESTKVTISDVHDPDDNLRTVTIDLSPFGGQPSAPMAEQGKAFRDDLRLTNDFAGHEIAEDSCS